MSQDLLILTAHAKKIRLLETRIGVLEKKIQELLGKPIEVTAPVVEEIPKKPQRKKNDTQ